MNVLSYYYIVASALWLILATTYWTSFESRSVGKTMASRYSGVRKHDEWICLYIAVEIWAHTHISLCCYNVQPINFSNFTNHSSSIKNHFSSEKHSSFLWIDILSSTIDYFYYDLHFLFFETFGDNLLKTLPYSGWMLSLHRSQPTGNQSHQAAIF